RDDKTAMLAHFRWSTSGRLDYKNTHPHELGDCLMAHNGVLSNGTTVLSDTAIWARLVGWRRTEKELLSKAFREHYEPLIGGGNKIAILGPSGRVSILNESAGHWRKGTWYS